MIALGVFFGLLRLNTLSMERFDSGQVGFEDDDAAEFLIPPASYV